MNRKTKKTDTGITLNSSMCVGIRQRIRHRLECRGDMLKAVERDFLMSIYERLAFSNELSSKQGKWLYALIERTDTAVMKKAAKVAAQAAASNELNAVQQTDVL
jgi:hypothetical protein